MRSVYDQFKKQKIGRVGSHLSSEKNGIPKMGRVSKIQMKRLEVGIKKTPIFEEANKYKSKKYTE